MYYHSRVRRDRRHRSSGRSRLVRGTLDGLVGPSSPNHLLRLTPRLSTNTAPSLGPVLGGVIAQRLGWRWIFWVLAILSGIQLLGMILFFPETARQVVGNGSMRPPRLSRTIDCLLRSRPSPAVVKQRPLQRSLYWPNPLACLPVLLDRSSALVMAVGGIFYMAFSCLAASLSTLSINLYDLNYLDAGLVYMPAGIGGILAAYLTGTSILSELLLELMSREGVGREIARSRL